ncbi:hypothetical protein ACF0H5_021870 [Mactra antiquata]
MTAVRYTDHPVYKDILDYESTDKLQSHIAFMVYMQLCEDKSWWNVSTHYCEEESTVFLSGHASKSKPREIILPISVDTKISQAIITKWMEKIKLPDYETRGMILAISGNDSSTVFYKLTDGLVPPEHPDLTEWKKYRHEETPDLRRHHVTEQTSLYIHNIKQQSLQDECESEHK